MNYPSFEGSTDTPIAYVKAVKAENLPKELRKQVKGFKQVFSVHDADGNVLAMVDNRARAFMLARVNEFQPVSVH